MLHNGTQIIFNYWRQLKAERPAPLRREISPASISTVLPSTFILQKTTEGEEFEFRLAGTNLCQLYNQELKSQTFISILDTHEQQLVRRLLDTVQRECVVLQLLLHTISDTGNEAYLECAVLPLADEQPRLIGAIHTFEMPYWVGAEQLISTTVRSVRLLDAERNLISLKNRPAIDMRERQKARQRSRVPSFSVLQGGSMLAAPQVAAVNKRPKLTVLQGGRD